MDQERIYKEMHELEGIIGYTFNNIQHLADAMNATKCNNPNRSKNNDEHMNHSLATVGDAILKAINAELLFQEGKNRGDITIQKVKKKIMTYYLRLLTKAESHNLRIIKLIS